MTGDEGRELAIEVGSLDEIVPVCNKILIRIDNDICDHKTESGLYLVGDPEYNKAASCNKVGTVISAPEKAYIKRKAYYSTGVEWETEIEVKADDRVVFGLKASYSSPAFNLDGKLYYLIDYSELIARIRDGEVYPLNGYIFFREIKKKKTKSTYFDTSFADESNKHIAEVTHIGKTIEWFLSDTLGDPHRVTMPPNIKVGDKLVLALPVIDVENNYNKIFGDLTYMQGRWVIGRIK